MRHAISTVDLQILSASNHDQLVNAAFTIKEHYYPAGENIKLPHRRERTQKGSRSPIHARADCYQHQHAHEDTTIKGTGTYTIGTLRRAAELLYANRYMRGLYRNIQGSIAHNNSKEGAEINRRVRKKSAIDFPA